MEESNQLSTHIHWPKSKFSSLWPSSQVKVLSVFSLEKHFATKKKRQERFLQKSLPASYIYRSDLLPSQLSLRKSRCADFNYQK